MYRRQRKICSTHISIKTSIKSWIKIKVHRVIEFKQEAWLKPYIDMNKKIRNKTKNDFQKDFFKLMNNSVLERQWKMLEITEISN